MLLWPDGFWCFREEHCEEFLREGNYRIVLHDSNEWRILNDKAATRPLNFNKHLLV